MGFYELARIFICFVDHPSSYHDRVSDVKYIWFPPLVSHVGRRQAINFIELCWDGMILTHKISFCNGYPCPVG